MRMGRGERIENRGWRMEDGGWRMEDGQWRLLNDGPRQSSILNPQSPILLPHGPLHHERITRSHGTRLHDTGVPAAPAGITAVIDSAECTILEKWCDGPTGAGDRKSVV